MLWREHQKRSSVKGVGTCGKNPDFLVAFVDLEIDLCAFAFPDPVSLEQLDSFGPVESVQLFEQALCISRNSQHPLTHRPPHDRKSANLAFPIDDFFISQNSAELRAPVHRYVSYIREANFIRIFPRICRNGLSFVCGRIEPGIINLEKNPLRPFVITWIGRVDFTLPVVGKTNSLELVLEFGHIFARGDYRVLAAFDRVLLSR